MISEETYMELHILKKQGKSIREISRNTGLSRNTVRKYLQGDKPCYPSRPPKAHKLDPYKSYLQQRVEDAKPNWIPGTVLLSEIQQQGYNGGITRPTPAPPAAHPSHLGHPPPPALVLAWAVRAADVRGWGY